jgi:major membrane immunogen (membrane-anchored lipoprotein)
MKRLIVVLLLTLLTACAPSDEGSDPVLEDGQVQPGEQ